MQQFKDTISWYQCKIGNHDKQPWELSMEMEAQAKAIDKLPKREATQDSNRELLDIELIKGKLFSKADPACSSYSRTWNGLVRMIFMPLFWQWWIEHTSKKFFVLALALYASQISVLYIYYTSFRTLNDSVSLFEITNPLLFMLVLNVIHTQIVFTQTTQKHTNRFRKRKYAPIRMKSASANATRPKKRKPKSQIVTLAQRPADGTTATQPIIEEFSNSERLKSSSESSEDTAEGLLEGLECTADGPINDGCSSDESSISPELLTANRKRNKFRLDQSRFISNGAVQSSSEPHVGNILSADRLPTISQSASTSQNLNQSHRIPPILIEEVPDVVAAAEGLQFSPALRDSPRPGASTPHDSNTPRPTHLNISSAETEDISDLETHEKPHSPSDTEWDNNRVYSSDVATTDSTSEVSSGNDSDEEAESAASRKSSHYLLYTPCYDRLGCVVWEKDVCKKVDLSVIQLGGVIERQVAGLEYEPSELVYLSVIFTLLIATFPFLFRFYHKPRLVEIVGLLFTDYSALNGDILREAGSILFGSKWQATLLTIHGVLLRLGLCALFCFLVIVAERSYWERLQYAKYFCYLTSARRSRKYATPHFRLNKVRNIKIWLSLRAYLKKRGPQRSVEVIVTAVFILMSTFLALMCIQLLTDIDRFLTIYANWELTLCCLALTIFLLRFYSLGTKIAKRYRNLSPIITEQINLYLHMEQKPHKKEELVLANSVLKLAEGLIKEIESPYKMIGATINPVLFNAFRLVILSAFSAVVSELLGFKLKLQNIKGSQF